MNTVKFYLGKRTKDTAKTEIPIVLAFNYAATRLYTQIGIRIIADSWDAKKQRIKSRVSGSLETNMFLDRLEKEVREIYLKALAEGAIVNNNYILSRLSIKQKAKEQSTNSFFEDWEKFLEGQKNDLGVGTQKTYRVSLNHFRAFCKSNNITPTFDLITPDLLNDFRNYLLKLNMVNDSAKRVIKGMRFFLNHAYRMGKHKNILYREFKLKEYQCTVHYLTWDEVMKLYNFENLSDYERQVRDVFVFFCCTGKRFGDGITLKKSQIKEQVIDGQKAYFIVQREQKTMHQNSLPLMPLGLQILDRYKHLPGDLALPDLSNQVMNKYLKKIAKRAGINDTIVVDRFRGNKNESVVVPKHKKITSHWGRKTFVFNCLIRKLPLTTIMAYTSHRSFKSFSHYFSVQNEEKFRHMRDGFPDTDNIPKE